MKRSLGALRFWAAMVALALIAVSSAMASEVTFAQYVQSNLSDQQWGLYSNGSLTTVWASGSVDFSLEQIVGVQTANFSFWTQTAQPGSCTISGCGSGAFTQPGYSGKFSFIDQTAGVNFNKNLLSGTFAVTALPASTGAQFSSSIGGTGGSVNASSTAGDLNQLVFTSDFIDFTGHTLEDSSWSLSSLFPAFSTTAPTGIALDVAYPANSTFHSAASGTFSTDAPATVPEPASLGLMGGGLFALAFVLRRRRS
jgi:hypothetical protein